MRAPLTQLYLHCVWATWDERPLITPLVEQPIYTAILAKCRELKCEPLAIGGMPNHVHLLVELPATLAVAKLLKDVKGASLHVMTHKIMTDGFFKWQATYGALTLQKSDVPSV